MADIPPVSQRTGYLHTVSWSELFPWLILFRAARAALMPRVIVLGLVGVLITQFGWSLVGAAFSVEPSFHLQPLTSTSKARIEPAQSRLFALPPVGNSLGLDSLPEALRPASSPVIKGWAWASHPLITLLYAENSRQRAYAVAAGCWALAVWTIVGGAITRFAALYLTRMEKIGPITSIRYAIKTWRSPSGAILAASLGLTFILLPLIVGGFAMRAGAFALPAALLWPLALALGAAAFVLGVGILFGWPLIWAGSAVEQTDPFDVLSRAYAFLLQRPFHFAAYTLLASMIGIAAQAAVSFVAEGTVWTTEAAITVGLGEAKTDVILAPPDAQADRNAAQPWATRAARAAAGFWTSLATGVAEAFPMAYLWPAMTAVYLLLRQHVDSTELDMVSLENESRGDSLPPLKDGTETGVPQVDRQSEENTTAAEGDSKASADADGSPPSSSE